MYLGWKSCWCCGLGLCLTLGVIIILLYYYILYITIIIYYILYYTLPSSDLSSILFLSKSIFPYHPLSSFILYLSILIYIYLYSLQLLSPSHSHFQQNSPACFICVEVGEVLCIRFGICVEMSMCCVRLLLYIIYYIILLYYIIILLYIIL